MQASKAPKRSDLSQRHATPSDLERIFFTVSMPFFGLSGGLPALSALGRRWLAWFAALNRCGEVGYQGVAAPIPAITRSEYKANGQTCSESTTHRALKELISKGYLTKKTPRLGRWRQYGIEDGFGAHDIICEYTLTAAALAIWSQPKLAIVESVPHIHTTANLAGDRSFECSNDPPSSDLIEQPRARLRAVELLEDSKKGKIKNRNKTRNIISRRSEKNTSPVKPRSRSLVQNLLLKSIRLVLLAEKNRKIAAAALALAKHEIDCPLDRKTPIEWSYWAKVWPYYSEQYNRQPTAQKMIVPLLIAAVQGQSFDGPSPGELIAAGIAAGIKKPPSPGELIAVELQKAKERLNECVKLGSMTLESAVELFQVQKSLLWQRANQNGL